MEHLLEEARRLGEAFESGEDTDPEEIAGLALTLARRIEDHHAALEGLKEALRAHARAQLEGPTGVVSLNGYLSDSYVGHVIVTFPDPVVRAHRDVQRISRLKKILGHRFNDFFEEEVSYKPRRDFLSLVDSFVSSNPSTVSKRLLETISVDSATPRVGFRPLTLGGSEPPVR